MITVNIFLPQQTSSVSMVISDDLTVTDVCKQIVEKFGLEDKRIHGLFQEKEPGVPAARWLPFHETLRYLDVKDGANLYYRNNYRVIKVKPVDGTIKTFLVFETSTVAEIIKVLCNKIGIAHHDEFGLQCESKGCTWLKQGRSLLENDVPDSGPFLLRRMFPRVDDSTMDHSDYVQIHILYTQCREFVISGLLPTHRKEALILAALTCQILYGDYDPKSCATLTLSECLSSTWFKQVKLAEIRCERAKLVGMRDHNAKLRYIQLCRSLKTYGIRCYEVRGKKNKRLVLVYLGISRDCIFILNWETHEPEKRWPFPHVKRWAFSDKSITLDFGDHESEYVVFQTTEGEAISELLGCCLHSFFINRSFGRAPAENRRHVFNPLSLQRAALIGDTLSRSCSRLLSLHSDLLTLILTYVAPCAVSSIALRGTCRLLYVFMDDDEKVAHFRPWPAGGRVYAERASHLGYFSLIKWAYTQGCSIKSSVIAENIAMHGDLATLQWAHAHGTPMGEKMCALAAKHGHLHILKWAREALCKWDARTFSCAVDRGDLVMLKWLAEANCPRQLSMCISGAAGHGHVHVLEWLRASDEEFIVDSNACIIAAVRSGHTDVIKWLVDHGYTKATSTRAMEHAAQSGSLEIIKQGLRLGWPTNASVCAAAARGGHLEALKLLVESGCAWDVHVAKDAAQHGHLEVLKWMYDNGGREFVLSNKCATVADSAVLQWLNSVNKP